MFQCTANVQQRFGSEKKSLERAILRILRQKPNVRMRQQGRKRDHEIRS